MNDRGCLARASLRTSLHLACVGGPDIGLVLAPGTIGRAGDVPLSCPSVAREHASFSTHDSRALLRRAPDVVTGAGADKSAGANAGAGEEAAAADGADKDAGASAGADKDATAETGTAPSNRPMRVFTTYTAMLALRARLGELTEVEEVMK